MTEHHRKSIDECLLVKNFRGALIFVREAIADTSSFEERMYLTEVSNRLLLLLNPEIPPYHLAILRQVPEPTPVVATQSQPDPVVAVQDIGGNTPDPTPSRIRTWSWPSRGFDDYNALALLAKPFSSRLPTEGEQEGDWGEDEPYIPRPMELYA